MLADPTNMPKPLTVKQCTYCRAPEVVDALMGLAKALQRSGITHGTSGDELYDAMKAVNQVISDSCGCRQFIARWSNLPRNTSNA